MSDNISRQAVLDIIGNLPPEEIARTWAYVSVSQLPSVDEWIPCSERLPEIEREGQRRGWYITTNGYGCVSLTQYEFYHDFLKTGWQSDIQIVAWMPLPEPYKKSDERPCTVASANVESYEESY